MSRKPSFSKQWLIPPGFSKLAERIRRRFRKRRGTIERYSPKVSCLYVLANGPSLAKDLEDARDKIMCADRLAVNYMATSSWYAQVRPTLYLLADPLFFLPFALLRADSRRRTEALVDALANRTSWPLTLIVPCTGLGSELLERVSGNPQITILCYDNRRGLDPGRIDLPGWSKGLVSPPAQTVVNTAVYLGIFWRYAEVHLIGADMSLHTTVKVEQDTNRLYSEDDHFYGSERRYLYKDSHERVPATMSWWLTSIARMFRDYEQLRQFADYQGVRVVNDSSSSFVDAFERPAQSDFPRKALP